MDVYFIYRSRTTAELSKFKWTTRARVRRHTHVVGARNGGGRGRSLARSKKPAATSCLIWRSAREGVGWTHAIPASPRTSRRPCPRDPAPDSGSPAPRPAPSSLLTSSPQEYTTLARPDSLRGSTHVVGGVYPRDRCVSRSRMMRHRLLRRTLFYRPDRRKPSPLTSDGGCCAFKRVSDQATSFTSNIFHSTDINCRIS